MTQYVDKIHPTDNRQREAYLAIETKAVETSTHKNNSEIILLGTCINTTYFTCAHSEMKFSSGVSVGFVITHSANSGRKDRFLQPSPLLNTIPAYSPLPPHLAH